MNPYKILGISESSSTEEIKNAYSNIIEKYSIKNAENDAERNLFSNKLNEANEAFRLITNMITCEEVRDLIEQDDFITAESKLNLISDYSSAEWNYLKGILLIKKGCIDSGVTHIRKSVSINPYNEEYTNSLKKINIKLKSGRSAYSKSLKSPFSLLSLFTRKK